MIRVDDKSYMQGRGGERREREVRGRKEERRGGRESVELCRGKRQAVVTGDSHGYIFIVDK